MQTKILLPTRDDVLLLHDFILAASRGRAGILHDQYIDAALERPYTHMRYKHVDLHTITALLIDSFGRNHAFNDGNKRTALLCTIYTYAINGVFLEFNQKMNDDFEEMVLWVVNDKPDIDTIRERLIKLVTAHKQGTAERFVQSMKDFFLLG